MNDLLRRRRAMMKQTESGLPSIYMRKNCLIATDGQSWINTEYIPVNDPRVEITLQITSRNEYDLFGFSVNKAPSLIFNQTAAGANCYNRFGPTSHKVTHCDLSIKKTLVYGREVLLDGALLQTFDQYNWSTNTQALLVFAGRTKATGMRVYDFKLYDGDNLVRDMIPCVRKSDDEPGLYDYITQRFFTNSGTGSFTYQ